MSIVKSACVAAVLLCAGCASNPFLENYRGARFPETPYATIAAEPPAGAREIGTSEFLSASGVSATDAAEAARQVGADFATWDAQFDGATRHVDYRPVTVPVVGSTLVYYDDCGRGRYGYASGVGFATAYEPYEYAVNWYRSRARFYRSWSLDPYPAAAPAR